MDEVRRHTPSPMHSSDWQSAESLPGASGLSLAARFSGKLPFGQNKTRCICARNSHSLEKNAPIS
jgi:hypothetical protein